MTASGAVDVTGSGYRPAGDLRADGRPLSDAALSGEVEALLTAACLANDAALRQEGGAWTIQGDPTDAALLVAEAKIPGLPIAARPASSASESCPSPPSAS